MRPPLSVRQRTIATPLHEATRDVCGEHLQSARRASTCKPEGYA
jgi:hypothetical protein